MPAETTSLTELFEAHEGYAVSRLAGSVTLQQAADAATRAIVTSRERGIRRLLVDGMQLTGFPSPSVADRYFITRGFAAASNNQVEVSFVLQQHIIDPDRFGIVVATNLGMRANVFSSPAEALAWLLSGQS
jgi:hypothetical protein